MAAAVQKITLDLFDNAASQRMKRRDAASQLAFLDLQLPGDPGLQFIGSTLVESQKQDLLRPVELLFQNISNLADHGRGLARARRGDQQVVVLEANAGFALLIGEGSPVEIVEEGLEFFQLRGDECFIIGLANARIRQEGERARQRRLELGRHQL